MHHITGTGVQTWCLVSFTQHHVFKVHPCCGTYQHFIPFLSVQFSSVQSLSHAQLFATPWTAPRQASLSITSSRSLLKLTSTESVMSSNHLIFCHPLLLLFSNFPSIRVFLELWSHAITKPTCCSFWSPCTLEQEAKPPQWKAHSLQHSPYSLQLEKAYAETKTQHSQKDKLVHKIIF